MLPISKVQNLILKHSQLEKELSATNIDKKNFAEKSKEYSNLNEIIKEAIAFKDFEKNIKDLDKIINDKNVEKDIKDLALNELEVLKKNNEINEKKIKLFLLPKDEADTKNAIIEIRAGTGGLEGLPLSPFIPTANTLLPPVNQEMIGNWGGGAANRQEWTGPLGVSPLTGPWATFLNPPPPWENYGSIFYNYEHPNWYDVQKSRQLDRYGDVQNFASNYWPYLVNPTSHLINQGIQNNDWLNNLYGNIRSRGY